MILTDLQRHIILSIAAGGFIGFIIGVFLTMITSINFIINTMFFGIFIGLFVLLIIEVNKIKDKIGGE